MGLAESTLSVIPIKTDGTKAPAMRGPWKPYQEVIAIPEEIATMFGRGAVGVAIVGGAVSNNLAILDVDNLDLWEPFWELVHAAG